MHMGIAALVYAYDKEEAISRAEKIFERLSGEGKVFDYWDRSGWAKKEVRKVTTKAGKKFMDELFGYQERDFLDKLATIRAGLAQFTDKQLFEDSYLDAKEKDGHGRNVRYSLYCVGQYEGHQIRLYDDDGSGITDKRHLDNVLKKWPNINARIDPEISIWIVGTDVHF